MQGLSGAIGRFDELSQLRGLVSNVALGRGCICWIQGEPGIGKSALADLGEMALRDAGAAVFRADGDALMTEFPLRLIAECLGISVRSPDAARTEIARLLLGGAVATIDPVLAASERILDLVDRFATAGPVALIMEDLHFADEPSLLLWNRLIRVVDQLPLLLLGTCRPVPTRKTVERSRAAVQDHDGLVLDLGPLSADAVAEMAANLMAARPGPRLSAELARAGGNPLYVRELVHALRLDGSVEVSGDVAELVAAGDATPGSLPAAIGRRLSFLSTGAVPVLRIAALLGNTFTGKELVTATGRAAVQLGDVVTEAVTAGVLVNNGDQLRFRHDLIRQALAEQVPGAMRETMHNDIARSLAATGASMDAVARHLLPVSDGLDGWAVGWLAKIQEPVLLASPRPALELLSRAVRLLGDDDPHWELLTARLINVLYWMGRNQELHEIAKTSLHRFRNRDLAARCRIQWARSSTKTGRFHDALSALEPMRHDEQTSPVWRARMDAWAGSAMIRLGQLDAGREMTLQALHLARETGDPLAVASALGAVQQMSDHPTQLTLIDEALDVLIGDDPDSVDQRIALTCVRALPLFYLGRKQEAQATLQSGAIMAERSGSARKVDINATSTELAFEAGNWDEALEVMSAIPREHLEGPSYCYLLGLAALIALHREDRHLATKHLSAAGVEDLTVPTMRGRGRGMYLTQALSMLAEVEGKLRRALDIQRSWLELDSHNRLFRLHEAVALVRLALDAGDRATAEAAATEAAVEAGRGAFPVAETYARTCQAILTGDTAELLAVAEKNTGDSLAELAAINYEEAAIRLAQVDDIRAARKAFTKAVQIYASLGATWDIRRADARLRPYGIRRGSRSLHRRSKTGWDALTPTEARIASLVARGMSNPDISVELYVSRNTVQTHVSNILSKLQLRSRIELIREVADKVGAPKA